MIYQSTRDQQFKNGLPNYIPKKKGYLNYRISWRYLMLTRNKCGYKLPWDSEQKFR